METNCDSTGLTTTTRDITGNAAGCAQLTPEDLMRNTTVLDITDDYLWMERARWLTAEAYSALANPQLNLSIEDSYELVSKDPAEERGCARTIAALTTDPATGLTEMTGMVRLVFGEKGGGQPGHYPIAAMHYMAAIQSWPHEQNGWGEDQIAELCRFIIIERCRTPEMRRAGVTARLTRRLYETAVDLMRSRQGRILYAIMPPYMARLTTQSGTPMQQIESRLRTEDESAAHMFEQLSLYWHHARPKLYYFPNAPAPYAA